MLVIAALGIQQKAHAAYTPVKPFSFAVVSDVHLTHGVADTYYLFNESQLFLQDAVKQINALNLDFTVFVGDMIEGPGKDEVNWNLFIDIMQTLNCRWDFVLGESDITSSSNQEKMRMFGPDWKGRDFNNTAPYWSYNFANNVHLIGLDTSKHNSKTGFVSDEQLEWLKNDLATHAAQYTIVFSHHPTLPPSPYDGGPPFSEYDITNGASVRELLNGSSDVKLAISGHVPVNAIQKESNIYYASCPSLIAYPCAFKVFRVDNNEIRMETHQISYKALVKKAEKALLESSFAYSYHKKNPADFVRLCEGGPEDTNAVLPLYGGMTPQPFHPSKEKPGKKNKKEKTKKKKGAHD
jgi:3',5'-cyclic AMP phosphodiesterase CpdA